MRSLHRLLFSPCQTIGMDPKHGQGLLKTLIPGNYAQQGAAALNKRQNMVTSLLSERRLPKKGWDEATIETVVQVSSAELAQHLASDNTLPECFVAQVLVCLSYLLLGSQLCMCLMVLA